VTCAAGVLIWSSIFRGFSAAASWRTPAVRRAASASPQPASSAGSSTRNASPGTLEAARQLLSDAAGRALDAFTAVIPGARWDAKRWRADRFGELINRLHAVGDSPVVLLGGPDDREFAAAIRAATQVPVVDLVGRTSLRELAALIALAKRVICHDSGPMHIAAALNKPIVALFGPTNPARTGPYCATARIVSLPLECVPCYRRQCPLGHHNCMQQLDVGTVLASVRECAASRRRNADSSAGRWSAASD
jgi:heptosyltransferase-2